MMVSNVPQADKQAELHDSGRLPRRDRDYRKMRYSLSFYEQLMRQDWHCRVRGRIRQRGWRW
jgi:hypothetical protein